MVISVCFCWAVVIEFLQSDEQREKVIRCCWLCLLMVLFSLLSLLLFSKPRCVPHGDSTFSTDIFAQRQKDKHGLQPFYLQEMSKK